MLKHSTVNNKHLLNFFAYNLSLIALVKLNSINLLLEYYYTSYNYTTLNEQYFQMNKSYCNFRHINFEVTQN